MKRSILLFIITLVSILSFSQTLTISNVFFNYASINNTIDTIYWDYKPCEVNFKIKCTNLNLLIDKAFILFISNEPNISLVNDSLESDFIYGRMILASSNILIGKKVIQISSKDNKYNIHYPIFIKSHSFPELTDATRQFIFVNGYSKLNLSFKNLQNLNEIRTFDIRTKKYLDFGIEIKILDRDYKNNKASIEVFCNDNFSLQNDNLYVSLFSNNVPMDTINTNRKVRDLFSRGNLIKRFNDLYFYENTQSDIVIKNKNYDLVEADDLKLIGLNNQEINLNYNPDDSTLFARGIQFKSTIGDCKILKNKSEADLFKIKITIIKIPKIDDSFLWKEVDNTQLSPNKPYVDHFQNKDFLFTFNADGVESSFINNLTIQGATNQISFKNLVPISLNNNRFELIVSIPKNTRPGDYILKYKLKSGETIPIYTIQIVEKNYPNTSLEFVNIFYHDEKNQFVPISSIKSSIISSWNKNNPWPTIKFKNTSAAGKQFVFINVELFNEKSEQIGIFKYSKNEYLIEDSLDINISPLDFDWINSKVNNLNKWDSYKISISFDKDKYYIWPIFLTQKEILIKEIILKGDRLLFNLKLSIPFAQTVFILRDSLKAAPYNFGVNCFFHYRKKDVRDKVFPLYWGLGFYATQNELLKEQALQIGLAAFGGINPIDKLNLALGFGSNWNIKFKKDANKNKLLCPVLVLNIGLDF
jgi:hypothetical protein